MKFESEIYSTLVVDVMDRLCCTGDRFLGFGGILFVPVLLVVASLAGAEGPINQRENSSNASSLATLPPVSGNLKIMGRTHGIQ